MLREGRWPQAWTHHWVCALFKSGSHADPLKYRGIHLTPVIANTSERVIKHLLHPFLAASGAFGANQGAYQAGRSCRDLLALLVAEWIQGMAHGKKVGCFFSDISGAFDRVCSSRMISKLAAAGVAPSLLALLGSWLRARTAEVVLSGTHSRTYALENMVFQGTVLGPDL